LPVAPTIRDPPPGTVPAARLIMSSLVSRNLVSLGAAIVLSGCATSGRALRTPVQPLSSVRDPDFKQAMGAVLGAQFVGGNRLTLLNNGEEIFPAMLQAIRGAKRTITFETFVFEKGPVPQAFAEALAERARAGVKVHAILDAHGAKKSRKYHSMLKEAGVELVTYHPITWYDIRRYNNRTHRKLLVVDGRVGFIGGVGIANQWDGHAESPEHWRDMHFKVEGPVVAELQGAFMDNWLKTRGNLLHGPDYFPALAPAGSTEAAAFYSSPRHGSYNVVLMYQLAISSARHSLQIENAYFVPDRLTSDALIAAAKRGVHVELVVPGRHIDQKAVRRASRKRWDRLLEVGIEIYEYQPTMIHSKLLIADGRFVSIGSANFDNRSLRLNDEANLNVLDENFAAQQSRVFARDRAQAERVTLENLRKKKLTEAPRQTIESPAASQL
jgi:cardiolipin synthase